MALFTAQSAEKNMNGKITALLTATPAGRRWTEGRTMYEELVKRLIERTARNNFPHHGEGYPTDDAMLMMQAADAIRAFLKAKDDGRLLILDDRAALAIAAGARSIRKNKRLAGTTYVYDVFGKDGGPYEINYNDASKILTTIWNAYPLPEPPKEEK